MTQVLDGQELTTRVEYDEFARPRVTHYPAAGGQDVRVENTYTNGLLTRVDDISATRKVLWEILSTEHGYRIKDEARGDQTTTTYGYQPRTDRIASISAVRGTALVQNLTYQYNANGTVRERHDHLAASFPEVFGYDELNRLKERRQQQTAGADLVDTFEYDALGNLTQMPGVGTYTFEPTRPQLVASAGSHQYHHDANGNLDSRSGPSVPGGSQTLAYNAFDMPKRITPGAASAVPDVDLEYDGFQNRAVKRATDVCSEATCGSTTTYYAGGGYTQTRRVEGATTAVEHRYRVFAGGGAIAELVRDGTGASVATWYPHTDALGSPNVLLDEAGTRLGQSFAPFGQATPDVPVGDSGSQMGFTGHDHDAEVDLIDMNGRVYDPTLGRFLTADPYVQAPFWSQGLNRYAYVFNSPLNYTDPSGFSAIDDYFQSLNDAPPEQAIPGYIGTALVVGLAAYTAYEAVSATISASASNAAATSIAESGGADAPAVGAPAAAHVAAERFGRAMGSTKKTVPGKPPTRSLITPTGGGQQSATVQNRDGMQEAGAPEGPRALERLDRHGEYSEPADTDDAGNYLAQRGPPRRARGAPMPGSGLGPILRPVPRAMQGPLLINTQQRAGHIRGTPQYLNRIKQGKPTSTFIDPATADALTIRAWQVGRPVGLQNNLRILEFGRPVGVGPDGGGYQTQVSMDLQGRIHGTPYGPVYFGPLPL